MAAATPPNVVEESTAPDKAKLVLLALILGVALSIPACCIAAWAPNVEILFAGRLIGGLAAGMAYPTTLALITALWSGPGRTRSIALWSALGGAISALGPLAAGWLLGHFWWGSPIGNRTFDDLYALGNDRNLALVAPDGASIELRSSTEYPYAQVWVPPDREFAALEPMTVPTNALGVGRTSLVAPGDTFTARFSLALRSASD